MVTREQLNNWENGNFSELDRADLIQLCRYFEAKADNPEMEMIDELYIEDSETTIEELDGE